MDSGPGNTSEGSTVEGRAWWGNSYFDPKSGRWRTPGDFIASSDLPPWSTAKLGLGVLILVGFGFLVWFGYRVFTEQTGFLWEPVVLLLGLTAWMLIVWFTRSRFRRLHPGFGSIVILVVSVLVALSFLGVQPLSTYKDVVVGFLLSVSTG